MPKALLIFFLLFCAFIFAEEKIERPKIVYFSNIEYPKNIYSNQIFELKINLTIAADEFTNLRAIFDKSEIKILNPNSPWRRIDTNNFENRYYLKALNKPFKIPTISVELLLPNGELEKESFVFDEIAPLPLKKSPSFSGVSGISLKITGQKISTFDEQNNIIVFELEGGLANLEDFYISGYQKQGIESKSLDEPFNQSILYYVILPKSVQLLEFEYFDINKSKYELIRIPNIPFDEKISTQSDIAPKSSLEIYKIALFSLFTFIFFLMLIIKRKLIYLFLMLLPIGGIGYLLIPSEVIILKKDSAIYILPTKNSTIFYVTDKEIKAKLLDKKGEYLKIELDDGKIGWIKQESKK